MNKMKQIKIRKSNFNASKEFDFYQLTRQSSSLIGCNVLRGEDEYTFDFKVDNAKPFNEIINCKLIFKYLALMNLKDLMYVAQELKFEINSENIYYDINMVPKVLVRDIYHESKYDEEHFLNAYKSMIGFVLNPKYTFNDYYQGGGKLLAKSKITSKYSNIDNVDALYSVLVEEYLKLEEIMQTKQIEIDKKKYRGMKIYQRLSIAVIVALVAITGNYLFNVVPEKTSKIAASDSFIKQEYIKTLEEFRNVAIDKLSNINKYVYAVSYIKTDALSAEQKNNILAGVSPTSNEKILDYWIKLDRGQVTDAIDLAKQLGSKEYTLYGYMKYKQQVESDSSISGEEREKQLKEIESKIEELTKEDVSKSKEGN